MERITTCESQFILRALKEGVRVDGRDLKEMRQVRFQFERSESQAIAEVQLGRSRVLCSVLAQAVTPYIDRPTEGLVNIEVDISPMAAAHFKSRGSPDPMATEIKSVLEKLLKDGSALDVEALCIAAGKKVWSLTITIHLVDHGGNAFDLSALALMGGLLHLRVPQTSVEAGLVVCHESDEREPMPLSIHHVPLCCTFCLFALDDTEVCAIVDPSDSEESVADGHVTYCLNVHKELCAINKLGGLPLAPMQIIEYALEAQSQVTALVGLLQSAVTKAHTADVERRVQVRTKKMTDLTAESIFNKSDVAALAATEPPMPPSDENIVT